MAESMKLRRGDAASSAADCGASLDAGELYRLVYFSVSLLPPLDAGGIRGIEEILESSQSRNRQRGITGALTFNDLNFAQVLEGARIDVGDIFRSVQRDPRHAKIIVVEEGWIETRDFAAWAMAYVGDPGSPRIISPNLQLRDILAQTEMAGMALIEMMKFCLLASSPKD